MQLLARVGDDERLARRERVAVPHGPGEERLGHLRVEPGRIGDAPPAERERAAGARTRNLTASPPEDLPRARDADERHRDTAGTARGRDPRCRGEDDARDGIGAERGCAQRDDAAERVTDPRRRHGSLGFRDREHRLGERVERRCAADRRRAAVPGQFGDDDAAAGGESRGDEAPVGGRPAQAVDEDDRGPGAAGQVPNPGAPVLESALLESLDVGFCVRPHRGIFCGNERLAGTGRVKPVTSTREGHLKPV